MVNKLRIAAIGVTGGTGASFVSQAIDRGHHIIALARRPEAVVVSSDRLDVVRADIRDVEALAAAVRGADVIVSLLGVSGLLQARKGTDVYSVGTASLIAAAEGASIKRLMVVTSSGVEPQANDGWFYTNVLKRFFLEPIYRDMRVAEAALRATELDWTIFRPSFLQGDKPRTDYRVSVGRNFDDDKSLSRWSLAHCILGEVEAAAHPEQMLAVSN